MRSRTSLVLSSTPRSVEDRSKSVPHAGRLGILTLVSAALLCLATPVRAQDDKLASLLLDLLTRSSINATDTTPATPVMHQPHFIPGIALKLAPRELNKAIALQLTTFPLPSSAGGFAYTTDPATGEIRLASATFGPVYAERALTIGKGRFDFGLSFQPTSFDSFETAELTDGGIKFVLEHNNCCPGGAAGVANEPTVPTGEGPNPFIPEFERDLLQSQFSLDIDTNTAVFFANYGISDRFDVGAAIPIVTVQLGGSVTSTILRTASAANPRTHSFDGQGLATLTAAETRSATGLGDILLRAKYNFVRQNANALAASIDLRLPTGDKDNLLGTGATQTKLMFMASGEYGLFAPHASFGYTFSNGNVSDLTSEVAIDPDLPNSGSVILLEPPPFDASVPDEINYNFGLSAAPHPRLTLGFDFIGRTIRDVFRFDIGDRSFPNRGAGSLPTASYPSNDEFLVRGDPETGTPENLNLLLGVIGGKVNIGRGLLVNAGVLFPLTNSGLQPKITPYFGFDYVF
jgi:Putative MetA-pathway of phenol degradation